MVVTIVGSGALGTILAAHLIAAGHEVKVIARGERARNIKRHGLRVRGLVELDTPCQVVAQSEALTCGELLIFAVKTYHMDHALAELSSLRPEGVFSVANGVMKNDQLAATYGPKKILGCMANFSGELLDNGIVEFTRNVCVFIGPTPGYSGPEATAIANVVDSAGVYTKATDRIAVVEWSKFAGWVALFSLSLLARTNTGTFLDNRSFASLGVSLIKEMAEIASARGIDLIDQSPLPAAMIAQAPTDVAVDALRAVGRDLMSSAPQHRMSSLQDLEAGRFLEVEETLGFAVREARRLQRRVPTLDACYAAAAGLNTLVD